MISDRVRRARRSPTRRAPAIALALAVTAALAAAACGSGSSPGPSFPASPVEGIIVAVDASSLSDVRGFTLLTRAGQRIVFTLGVLENPTEFPPGHLTEHQATSEPVRVFFRVDAGVPVVYRLADAAAPSPGASPGAS